MLNSALIGLISRTKEGFKKSMHGRLFESVRSLTLLIFGMILSKGFFAKDPEDYSLPLKILYYSILIILDILAVIIAGIVVVGVLALIDWLFDLIWPMIWPK